MKEVLSALICVFFVAHSGAQPDGYVPLSQAPGYAQGGYVLVGERYERKTAWASVEPTLPEDEWLRARATDLFEMCLRHTAGVAGSPDEFEQARWWLALDEAGWSHPYTTSLSIGAVLGRAKAWKRFDEVRAKVANAIDALCDPEATPGLPAYRRALGTLAYMGALSVHEVRDVDYPGLFEKSVDFLIESMQSARPVAERVFALNKTEVNMRSWPPEVRRGFIERFRASADPDPYAVAYLAAISPSLEAWDVGQANGDPSPLRSDDPRVLRLIKEAERLALEAYAIDPGFFGAPSTLAWLAKSGRTEKGVEYWHDVTLRGTPSHMVTFRNLQYLRWPERGGSPELMAETLRALAEHARIAPRAAVHAVEMTDQLTWVERDARAAMRPGTFWPVLRDVWLEVTDPSNDVSHAFSEKERIDILNCLVLGAWASGEYDLAARVYPRLPSGLDTDLAQKYHADWAEIRMAVPAMGTYARADIIEGFRLRDEGRFEDSLAAFARATSNAVGAAGLNRSVHEGLSALHARAMARARYERGEWVDLRFPRLREARLRSGAYPVLERVTSFRLRPEGIIVHRDVADWGRLLFHLPVGDRYEFEAVFVPKSKPRSPFGRVAENALDGPPIAGVGLGLMARYPWADWELWALEVTDDSAVTFGWGSERDRGRVELEPEVVADGPITLRFRRDGLEFSAWVNDEPVTTMTAQSTWRLGDYVCLVSRAAPDRPRGSQGAVATGVRVRKLD